MTWRLRSGETLALTGVGAVSSVGGTAAETAASVRAGICRFEEATFYRPLTADPEWDRPEPLIAAKVADLPVSVRGADRIRELGARALRDLLRTLGVRRADLGRAGLFLALPEPDEVARGWAPGPALGAALCEHLGLPPLPVVAARGAGSAGSLAILDDAGSALAERAVELAIVLGIDSFIDRDRLRLLDGQRRIKSGRVSAGMIPGEAAVALALERRSADGRGPALGGAPLATLAATGSGEEPQPRGGEAESSGAGLAQALRLALAGAGAAPRWVICDLDGDPYRAMEWGIVHSRLARELGEIARLSHAADCLGSVGAATGGLAVVQAAAGFARGYAPAGDAVLWAAADGKLRAAARLGRAPAEGVRG
jgi:3-oxoacyl-[acyl-carrier-protein] synthase-1